METNRQIAEQMVALAYPTIPISNETKKLLASLLVRIDLKKKDKFLNKGEICKYIGYVQEGMIRQYYYKNNKELTEHFACEKTIFICIESFLRQEPSNLIAEALLNSVVYGVSYDDLHKWGRENYELETVFRGWLEDSLVLSQRKTDSMRFETANERYHRLLREHPEVIRLAPLSEIASYLLMTPETLSRVRAGVL